MGKPTQNVDGSIPWAGDPKWIKRGTWAEHKRLSVSAPWVQMKFNKLPRACTTIISSLRWAVPLNCELKLPHCDGLYPFTVMDCTPSLWWTIPLNCELNFLTVKDCTPELWEKINPSLRCFCNKKNNWCKLIHWKVPFPLWRSSWWQQVSWLTENGFCFVWYVYSLGSGSWLCRSHWPQTADHLVSAFLMLGLTTTPNWKKDCNTE